MKQVMDIGTVSFRGPDIEKSHTNIHAEKQTDGQTDRRTDRQRN